MLPEVAQPHPLAESPLDQAPGRLGDEDLAAVRRAHDPRRSVDIQAHVRVGSCPRLAAMQADPDPQLAILRPGFGADAALHLDRSRDRLSRALEDREERVALAYSPQCRHAPQTPDA